MNKVLADVLRDNSPSFNKEVTNGLACKVVPGALDYIDKIIISSMRSAPKDLEYHGCRRLTPKEEFKSLFTKNDSRIDYDIAKSDLNKVELLFSYKGKSLPRRFIYVPFVGDAGIMHISDAKYHIVPVLSDTVVSPNHKEVFVRLLRDKLIFKRINSNVVMNGEKISSQVIYTNMYRTTNRTLTDQLGNVVPPVTLYIVAKLGLMGAFQKYGGFKPIITTAPVDPELLKEYDVYESTKIKPRNKKDHHYVGHNIKVYVPKKKNNAWAENMVAGLIYIFDIFPENAEEMVKIINSNKHDTEIMYWMILLGRIIFKDSYSTDRAHGDMVDHFQSLESYIDTLIQKKLAENNIYVDDFFDLLSLILEQYSDWLLHSKEYSSNIYNRYLDILYYLLYDIILGINKTIFDLTRKSNQKELSEPQVIKIFNNHLSQRSIFQVVKPSGMNISLMLVDYTGDNMYPKVTSVLEIQERGNGVSRGRQSTFPENTKAITGHDCYLGSILYLSKKAPTPRLRINPFIELNTENGRITPGQDMMHKLSILNDLISGKSEENSIIRRSELPSGDEEISLD